MGNTSKMEDVKRLIINTKQEGEFSSSGTMVVPSSSKRF